MLSLSPSVQDLGTLGLFDSRAERSSLLPVHWQYRRYMELASYFCCHWLSFTQMCTFLIKPHICWLTVMRYSLFHQSKEVQALTKTKMIMHLEVSQTRDLSVEDSC